MRLARFCTAETAEVFHMNMLKENQHRKAKRTLDTHDTEGDTEHMLLEKTRLGCMS